MMASWVDFALIMCAATFGAGAIVCAARWIDHRKDTQAARSVDSVAGPVLLFEGETLLDATQDALGMISAHLDHMTEYDAAIHTLSAHFPDLPDALSDTENPVQRLGNGRDGNLWLDIERMGTRLRLSVGGEEQAIGFGARDLIERDTRMAELATLRHLTQHTPQLIWQDDLTGKLLWANQSYLTFCDKLRATEQSEQPVWPKQSVFPDLHEASFSAVPSTRRLSVPLADQKAEQWFDITSVRRDDTVVHFANDANAIVRADQERRNFVQTLTKTFAQLSIGLAIFDKRRQLAMFNPALLDMTNLPFEFLSGRPTVDAVLDRLRESRMLPEPKDYASWRDQFVALEQAAKDGSYSEVWNLPEGQTYRVTGRPHPDGAIAFLFEDISAEISLTRRFRADIETGQAVIDKLPEAIAVFSSAGTLVMANEAYCDLWGPVEQDQVQPQQLQNAIQLWQERCAPTPMWADLRSFIHLLGTRKPWSARTLFEDGRPLKCQADPIVGGRTMVRFSFAPAVSPVARKVKHADPALLAYKR
ncbi:PAS-domain containing protein [Yoonia sp. SS1-5]|uniref:PAS-domain containing protein n=1 Tax=Yoonia rhodophyticola TaxID=3137370 RepID=A0AAN0MED9_9RHOB